MDAIGGAHHHSGRSHLTAQVVVRICCQAEVAIQQGDEGASLLTAPQLKILQIEKFR